MNIISAERTDLDKIVQLDSEVIGNTSRKDTIETAIVQGRCFIVKESDDVVGFSIYDTNFFECTFITLIIVSPSKRRKGYGSLLLNEMVRTSPTQKVFSSTNRSNKAMHSVFESNGFVKSGIVENLDDGDPEIIYFKLKP
ncbi:GNAT family N-acetyltransferase [Ornithinibacillus californiensis]|uniref:GNAT family N-acetyltransferase n=1 Tax=Ornithinibacillus californiensis TaxID=161536 RepID=UPI00064D8F23|nr:GNAT family N-acetyltransferase [Ornithinibacillus californiensis]